MLLASTTEKATETRTETRPPLGLDRWFDDFVFCLIRVAEDGGFEPPRALTQPAFQASAIGH